MIFHRDVKSLNIVLDEFLNARLIDFGLAREMKFGNDKTKTTRYYATLGYGKLTQQQIVERHDDYRYFGVGKCFIHFT
jgi:serine/threonine protein kinase